MPLKSQARGTKPRPNSDTARCQSLWLQSTRARKIMLFVSHFLSFFAPFFPSSSSCSHGLFADGFWLCNALNSFVSSLFLFCGVFVCLFVCLVLRFAGVRYVCGNGLGDVHGTETLPRVPRLSQQGLLFFLYSLLSLLLSHLPPLSTFHSSRLVFQTRTGARCPPRG